MIVNADSLSTYVRPDRTEERFLRTSSWFPCSTSMHIRINSVSSSVGLFQRQEKGKEVQMLSMRCSNDENNREKYMSPSCHNYLATGRNDGNA